MHSLYLRKVGITPMLTPEAIFQAQLWFWVDTGWLTATGAARLKTGHHFHGKF